MDKTNPLSTSMVVRSLNVKKNPLRPCEDNEELPTATFEGLRHNIGMT